MTAEYLTLEAPPDVSTLDARAMDVKSKITQDLQLLRTRALIPLKTALEKLSDEEANDQEPAEDGKKSPIIIKRDELEVIVKRTTRDNPSYRGIFDDLTSYGRFSASNAMDGILRFDGTRWWNAKHLQGFLFQAYEENNTPTITYSVQAPSVAVPRTLSIPLSSIEVLCAGRVRLYADAIALEGEYCRVLGKINDYLRAHHPASISVPRTVETVPIALKQPPRTEPPTPPPAERPTPTDSIPREGPAIEEVEERIITLPAGPVSRPLYERVWRELITGSKRIRGGGDYQGVVALAAAGHHEDDRVQRYKLRVEDGTAYFEMTSLANNLKGSAHVTVHTRFYREQQHLREKKK